MGIYRIDADYNAEGPVLTNSDDDFPARIQVATKDSFGELRLSRDEYTEVLTLVGDVVENSVPDGVELEDGRFAVNAAPPATDDTWEIELRQAGLQYKFTLSESELEGLDRLLRTIHPDHDVDASGDENVEVKA